MEDGICGFITQWQGVRQFAVQEVFVIEGTLPLELIIFLLEIPADAYTSTLSQNLTGCSQYNVGFFICF